MDQDFLGAVVKLRQASASFMFVENALAIVVWAPVAVNTFRVGVMLTRAAYYARAIVRTGLNWSGIVFRGPGAAT